MRRKPAIIRRERLARQPRPRLAGRAVQYKPMHGERGGSLIDAATGQRLAFHSEGIEGLLRYAVQQLGYRLIDYRLELFGLPDPASKLDPARRPRATGSLS